MVSHIGAVPRVALVTGGARGIGKEIVLALAARGLRVGCGYLSSGALARDLAAASAAVYPVRYELGSASSAEAAVAATVEHFGRLDSLVLNAGVWSGGLLERADPRAWAGVVECTLNGAAQLCRASLPYLREGANASIVMVSSVVGEIGFPGDTAYAAAKAGLVGLARSLAKEVARDQIRVNVLAPGFAETDMTAGVSASARNRIVDRTLLGRFAAASEIARAAVFLSEDATFCTGTVLNVDGGWSI
jgi:3-oxoacyl-[acyl-carrier protein] reductase